MRYHRLAGTWRILITLGILAMALGGDITPILAHPQASSYQIALTASTTSTVYGEPGPTLHALLTYPQGDPAPDDTQFKMTVGGQSVGGDYTGDGPNAVLLIVNVGTLDVGQYTIVSTYYDASSQTTVTSNSVVYTVNQFTPSFTCEDGAPYVVTPNQSLTFTMQVTNTNMSGNPPGSSFTVKLAGTKTYTYSNLTVDSNDETVIHAPTTPGIYNVTCTFNGTTDFAPTGFSLGPLTVSQENQVGGIKLYTDPTTLVSGKQAEYYIVVQGGPGLPTPTGKVSLSIPNEASTGLISLTSSGDVLITIYNTPYVNNSTTLTVFYYGSPVYNVASKNFSISNPAIPSGGGGGGSGTPVVPHMGTPGPGTPGAGTVTPTGASASSTATSTLLSQAGGSSGSGSSGSGLGSLMLIALLVVALLVIGGLGLCVYLLYRSRQAAGHAAASATYFNQGRFDQGRFDQGRFDQGRFDQGRFDQGRFDPRAYDQRDFDERDYDQRDWDQRGRGQRDWDQRSRDQRDFDQRGRDQRGFDQRDVDQRRWDDTWRSPPSRW